MVITSGSGFFGSPGTCNVADQYPTKHAVFIKMCKQGEPDQLKELFFMEAAILGQFNHPNVLQLVGVALKGKLIIFRPYIMGEEIILCVAFFPKFCQISTLLLHLVNSSHNGAVGGASAWQTRGRGFEPVLKRYIFSGKYPSAWRASCSCIECCKHHVKKFPTKSKTKCEIENFYMLLQKLHFLFMEPSILCMD